VLITSRVEGIHGLVKSYLKRSTFDLFEVWNAMRHALSNQLKELDANQAKQSSSTPTNLSNSLFDHIQGWVSHEAIRQVEAQRQLLEMTDPPISPICKGRFKKIYGLPCAHDIEELLVKGECLKVEHFHQHWHLKRE
jgi:hypothetical protein